MTIHIRTDSDGNDHQVWAQRQTSSCVIASIWMARSIARQQSFDEGEWELAKRLYFSVVAGREEDEGLGPQTFDRSQHANDQTTMGNTFSRFGILPRQICSMMAQEGFTTTMQTADSIQTHRLGPTKPALVGLKWRANGQPAGGHRIVCAGTNSTGKLIYLDPGFDGRLLELPNDGVIPHPRAGVSGKVYNVIYITGGNI